MKSSGNYEIARLPRSRERGPDWSEISSRTEPERVLAWRERARPGASAIQVIRRARRGFALGALSTIYARRLLAEQLSCTGERAHQAGDTNGKRNSHQTIFVFSILIPI